MTDDAISGGEGLSLFDRLAEPFNASCVEWLPRKVFPPRNTNDRGYGVSHAIALSYIDARSVMARLDEVVGPANWQDSYRWEGNRTICRIEINIDGEWIGKEDGSGDSNFEAEKGGISGAFKRAAVKWGIGRYLYDVPEVRAECDVRVTRGKGNNSRDNVYFNGWTDAGKAALADALSIGGGRRETGKPHSVELMIEKIASAESVSELHEIYHKHWEAVSIEYRAEILRKLDDRKEQIENAAGSGGTENEGNENE